MSSKRPVLLEFTTYGRADCASTRQLVDALASTCSDRLVFVRIDIDTSEGATLAEAYGATLPPHILLVDAEGRVTSRLAGPVSEASLRDHVDAVTRISDAPRPRPSCCGQDDICGKPQRKP